MDNPKGIYFVAEITGIQTGSILDTYGDTTRIRDKYEAYADLTIKLLEHSGTSTWMLRELHIDHPKLVYANVYDDFDEGCEHEAKCRFCEFEKGKKIRVSGRVYVKSNSFFILHDKIISSWILLDIDTIQKFIEREIVNERELAEIYSAEVNWSCIEIV